MKPPRPVDRILAVAAVALLAAACSNTDGRPRPVDPPDCYPHCTTRP